jgi:uncharacterized membrane protein YqjE
MDEAPAPESATTKAPSQPTQASAPASQDADASVIELARQTATYVRAWVGLVASEAALAKVNLIRILLVALVVPALALGVLLCIDALLVAALHVWLEWPSAIGLTVLFNIGLLVGVFLLLRRWWRSLFLPRSRAALSRFLEGLQ